MAAEIGSFHPNSFCKEPCLFLLFDKGVLIGLLCTHVDDLYATGHGDVFEKTFNDLKTKANLTVKYGQFRYCGKRVAQAGDYSITISQAETAALKEMALGWIARSPTSASMPHAICHWAPL